VSVVVSIGIRESWWDSVSLSHDVLVSKHVTLAVGAAGVNKCTAW